MRWRMSAITASATLRGDIAVAWTSGREWLSDHRHRSREVRHEALLQVACGVRPIVKEGIRSLTINIAKGSVRTVIAIPDGQSDEVLHCSGGGRVPGLCCTCQHSPVG